MLMSRRAFVTKASSTAVSLTFLSAIVGCGNNAQVAKTLIQEVGISIVGLAKAIGQTTLAATLQKDFDAAQAAFDSWTPGTTAQNAIQLFNTLIKDINLIPVSPEIQSFITLALAGVSSVISILNPPAKMAAAAHVTVAKRPAYTIDSYKVQWNQLRQEHPSVHYNIPVLQ